MKKHGAIYGQGVGLQGNSYAIPTKDWKLRSLPLEDIEVYVSKFILFAKNNLEKEFIVTPIGCGLAGYSFKQIAPFFKGCSANVKLPQEFIDVLLGIR